MSAVSSPPQRGSSAPGRERWSERAGRWLSEEALTGLLALLLLDMLVLPALAPKLGAVALNLVFTVLLFTGLATVSNRRVASAVVGVLVLAAVVLRWTPGRSETPILAVGAGVASLGLMAVLVLLRALSPGPITRRRIEGAVAAYLLIAMTFAMAFELLEMARPGSFRFGDGEPEAVKHALGYLSMVTLTTVGYGDVTPATPLARRLAMLEGSIGQLYPAIIIGWMVSSLSRRQG
jgi:hypothetical protein